MSKFKVGDKVKIGSYGCHRDKIVTIKCIEDDSKCYIQNNGENLGYGDGFKCKCGKHNWFIEEDNYTLVEEFESCEIISGSKININKKQTIMSKLTTFVKNSLLSVDEKALRQVGLKTECGEYTQEAIDLLLQEMCAEKEARLIEVANGLLAEDKKNK